MSFWNKRRAGRLASRRPHEPYVPPSGYNDAYPGSYTGIVSVNMPGLAQGDPLVIPAGENWLYDLTDSPGTGFSSVTIAGNLYIDTTKTTRIAADYFSISPTGKYQCGRESAKLSSNFTHTICPKGLELSKAVAYSTWQSAASGSTTTGLMKSIWEGAGIDRAETYTVTFTGTGSTFSVSGSSSGPLGTGSVGTAFNNKIYFIATGTFAAGNTRTLVSQAKAFNNSSLSRGFIVDDGGSLLLFGGSNKTHRARLQGTSGAPTFALNATALVLDAIPTNWKASDTIGIGTTNFFQPTTNSSNDISCDQRTLVSDVTTTALTINSGLSTARYAVKQYVVQTANDAYGREQGSFSLTDTSYVPHKSGVPKEVDERAWVINLTRNIIFEGPDDATWQATGTGRVGAHMMIMGRTDGKIKVDGVLFRRVGQRGRIGRYGIHFHMNSWEMPNGMGKPTNGVYKGRMTDTYVKNCACDFSAQHFVQLHGVDGVVVQNCVSYNVAGHAYNLEDGSERKNSFIDNVAMQTLQIDDSTTLQNRKHEANAAGFWITNPDTTLTGNVNVRSIIGIWFSPAAACFGLSRDIAMRPERIPHGPMENNYSITTKFQGAITGHIVSDELGTATGGSGYYWPTSDETLNGPKESFTITGYQLYKCGKDSYANRGGFPNYVNFVVGDSVYTDFSGSIEKGWITDSLVFNKSLNTGAWKGSTTYLRRAMASYHYTLVPRGTLFVGFGASRPADSVGPLDVLMNPDSKHDGMEACGGAIGSEDLYMKAIEMGTINIENCKFLSTPVSIWGRPWNFRIKQTLQPSFDYAEGTIAGARWDPHGFWGPAGNYTMFNDPMWTYGATTSTIPDDPYSITATPANILPYGPKVYQNNNDPNRLSSITMTRRDPGTDAVVGTWNVQARDNYVKVKDKMFLPAVKNGVYTLDLQSGRIPTTYLSIIIDNANRSDDSFVYRVSWAGANTTPWVYVFAMQRTGVDSPSASDYTNGYARDYTAAASIAALKSGPGDQFFYDKPNGHLYFKYKGGFSRPESLADEEFSWNEWVYQLSNTLYIRN